MKKNGESNKVTGGDELPPPPPSDDDNNNEDDVSYLEVHREELLPAGAIPPPNHAELEEEAAQHATQASIRSSHGAFAVTPGQNNSIEPRVFTADDAPSSSRQSSGGAAVAGSSLGATGTLLSDGGGSNNNSNNGGGGTGGANYSGNYLPANIDIIAEATLVPDPELESQGGGLDASTVSEITEPTDLNRTPTVGSSVTASCELAPMSNRRSHNGGDESLNNNNTTAAAAADLSQSSAANNLPVAKAEPMGRMGVTVCNRHIRLRWWHLIIVLAIILVVVLPPTLILGRKKDEESWIDTTDDLQSTIQQILVENYISNPVLFNDTSSPQYEALNWMGTEGGADTIKGATVQDATPYIIQRYILGVLYYMTTGSKWRNQYDFLSNVNECEWGVGANNGFNVIDCNEQGFVTLINLWQNNLMGFVPTELYNLTYCRSLDFLTNRLRGRVPEVITEMTQLTYLNLGYNQFTGTVMAEYGNLTNISKYLLRCVWLVCI